MLHPLVVIGSIVGFITGVYTLIDRVFVRRPSLWFRKGKNYSRIVLCVQNNDAQDVVVIGSKVRPRIYAVANADFLDATVDAAADTSPYRIIAPGSTAELPLITLVKDGKAMDGADRMVWIWLYWRRTGSMRFPRIPLFARLKTSDVVHLSGAEVG